MQPARQEVVQNANQPTSGSRNTAADIPIVGKLAFHVLGDRRVRVKIVAVERNGSRVVAKQTTTRHVFAYSKRADGGYRIVGATGKSGASLVFAQPKRSSTWARAPVVIKSPRPRIPASVRQRRPEIKLTHGAKRRLCTAAKASVRGLKAEQADAKAALAQM
jgi:hypothetical protein